MRQINYGKIVGEDGFDYLITVCVERVDMLPQQVPAATRYYVGADVPRSIYHYDGTTWVNEGTKYYDTPEGSDQLDIYKFEMDINEVLPLHTGVLMPGHNWGTEFVLENAENRGEPVKIFGYSKYRVTKSSNGGATEDIVVSNFAANMQTTYDKKGKEFYGFGTNIISYATATDEAAMLLFGLNNADYENNPWKYDNGVMLFLRPPSTQEVSKVELLNLDLTILYKK